jgi:acetylornithine/N-succinyldiaminopimelate aminotransferase
MTAIPASPVTAATPASPATPTAAVAASTPAGHPSAVMDLYGHPALGFVRGRGSTLWTADGTAYLDLASGIAVCGLGHCHPHLVAALSAQAQSLWHVSNLYRVESQERLAARLTAATFADRAFICNSGTEAIEACIKVARRFHHAAGRPERVGILTIRHAFHGRSFGALSATGNEKYLAGCGPRAAGFETVDVHGADGVARVEPLAARVDHTTAAILVEPVQGEGGVRPVPAAWLQQVRRLCDEQGLLLMLDEVQCGFGRTGRMFAHEHAGITPDVMAVAKGMGGGFPVGACLATEAAASGMTQGAHGSTFGGNPLACAVAGAVLDVLESPGFLEGVTSRAARLREGLESLVATHPGVLREVRGMGFMQGLVTVRSDGATHMRRLLQDLGVLVVTAGPDVVRLLPPLVLDEAEIDRSLAALEQAAIMLGELPA